MWPLPRGEVGICTGPTLSRPCASQAQRPRGGLTWAVCRLLRCHLHEESHLLALREWVTSSDPRQPHAEQQPGLSGNRFLLDPLSLRTLLLCAVGRGERRGDFMPSPQSQGLAWPSRAPATHPTTHRAAGGTLAGSADTAPPVSSGCERHS